jgi:hypothetical protein
MSNFVDIVDQLIGKNPSHFKSSRTRANAVREDGIDA